jgi:hypothetical protein
MDLSNLNWDNISKTIGTIGDTATAISGTVKTLQQSKVSQSTMNQGSGSGGGLLAALAVLALLVIKK